MITMTPAIAGLIHLKQITITKQQQPFPGIIKKYQ
jgi:hypothetical protein